MNLKIRLREGWRSYYTLFYLIISELQFIVLEVIFVPVLLYRCDNVFGWGKIQGFNKRTRTRQWEWRIVNTTQSRNSWLNMTAHERLYNWKNIIPSWNQGIGGLVRFPPTCIVWGQSLTGYWKQLVKVAMFGHCGHDL